jgi:hypothetical protein
MNSIEYWKLLLYLKLKFLHIFNWLFYPKYNFYSSIFSHFYNPSSNFSTFSSYSSNPWWVFPTASTFPAKTPNTPHHLQSYCSYWLKYSERRPVGPAHWPAPLSWQSYPGVHCVQWGLDGRPRTRRTLCRSPPGRCSSPAARWRWSVLSILYLGLDAGFGRWCRAGTAGEGCAEIKVLYKVSFFINICSFLCYGLNFIGIFDTLILCK